MSRKVTIGVLIGTAALLIAWDIYVALNDTPGDTISEVVLGFTADHPIIPFAVGVIMGHLFWPQHKRGGGRG